MNNYRKKYKRYSDIANIIRKKRIELGYTVTELAYLCGVSQGTVSNWEHGIYEPPTTRIDRVCEVLGIDVGNVLPKNKE